MNFRAVIEATGKNTTGIVVPEEIVLGLGSGKRPPVRATINGYTFRTSIAKMGGVFMLSVSAETREKASVAAGDEVEVGLELDTEPREVTVPEDLAMVLKKDAAAAREFESLSYSHKRRHVIAIEEAKSPETRQRRIEKAVEMLRQGQGKG